MSGSRELAISWSSAATRTWFGTWQGTQYSQRCDPRRPGRRAWRTRSAVLGQRYSPWSPGSRTVAAGCSSGGWPRAVTDDPANVVDADPDGIEVGDAPGRSGGDIRRRV